MKMFALVLGVLAVSGAMAQDAVKHALPAQIAIVQGACPVGMSAERQPSGQVVRAAGAVVFPPKVSGAAISVVLVAPAGKMFHRAEVEVEYSVPQSGLTPVEVRMGGVAKPSAVRMKRFTLEQAVGAARLEDRLDMGEAGTITKVRLVSATYMDGSGLDDGAGCSVRPSALMLVAGN